MTATKPCIIDPAYSCRFDPCHEAQGVQCCLACGLCGNYCERAQSHKTGGAGNGNS